MVRSEKRIRMWTCSNVRLRDELSPSLASSFSRIARVSSGASGPCRPRSVERNATLSSSGVGFRSSSETGGIAGYVDEDEEGGRNTRTEDGAEAEEVELDGVETCSFEDDMLKRTAADGRCLGVTVGMMMVGSNGEGDASRGAQRNKGVGLQRWRTMRSPTHRVSSNLTLKLRMNLLDR